MSHRRWSSFLMALVYAATLASSVVGQQRDAEVALQQAMQVEQVQGDLERAIRLYQDIIAHHGDARAVAAKALLQLGQCYEKLGRTEATNAYQRLVREYGDQSEMVAAARARLAALQPTGETLRGPVARLLLSSRNPADQIQNPRIVVPSPDGRSIAYFQNRGIYIRDLATGSVEQVATAGPKVDVRPAVWSANGKRVAFSETDTETGVALIRIVDRSSHETRTLPVEGKRRPYLVDWSRDGRYFLANDLNGHALYLVQVSDGTMTVVCDSVWPWIRATFSPDGRFVTYASGANAIGPRPVCVQSVTGGPCHEIAKSGDQMYPHPLWSPDGSAIAHQEANGIWVVPMADGRPSGPQRLAYRTTSGRWAASWAASGGLYYTAFEQRNAPWRVEVDPSTGRVAGAGAQELTDYPHVQSFRWSADGRRVAITGWENDLTVYSVESKASTSYPDLEQEGGVNPGIWSPDGRELWYEHVSESRDSGRSVKALDLATGQVRGVFTLMHGGGISFSADARTMTFVRPGSHVGTVEIVLAETGKADGRVIATVPGPDGIPLYRRHHPQLSPQGDQVLYVVQQPPPAGPPVGAIWVVGTDGAPARRVATATNVLSAMWDPSGKLIAYTARTTDRTGSVLRVVDVITGAEHELPVPNAGHRLMVADWSRDGRYIGYIRFEVWWEYWVVEGLLDGGH